MAEASTFYLEIITPERQFYIGPAEALVFPAVDGEMGVYPGHEPAVTAVEPGELRYKVDGKWEPAAVGAGFVEIKPDYVILLVGFAEHPEEIDRKRAEAARERAEERLRQKQSIHEYYHSKAALARSTCSRRSFSARRVSSSCFSSSFIRYSSVSMVSSALRRSSSSASFTHGSCSRMVRLDSRGERDSSVLASAV